MRTGLTLLQSNLIDADVKTDVSWLFEVDATGNGSVDYYWSTKAKTWNGQAYTYKVMNFSPIRLERNRSEYGVTPPSTFSFTITNEDATLLTSDFSGGNVTVRCVVKADLSSKFAPGDVSSADVIEESFNETEGEIFTFNFDMLSTSAQYQKLIFECRDWLTKYLEGSYPNTSALGYLWPSIENTGNTIVPVIYGTAYLPLYSAFITDDRYYILGAAGPTYTIIKSRSPVEIATVTEWLPASYTFTQATKAGADGNNYRVFRLFGTTTSEEESSNVIYRFFGRTDTVTRTVNLGTDYMSLPTKISQSVTVSTTAPTDIIDSILQDMGVPSARIDATTKATCATTHSSWGLTWNVGLFNVEDRRTILSRLLQNCHMELVVRDKIYFKIHSKTSQRAIEQDMVIAGTFSYQGVVPEKANCGYVLYPHPSGDVPLNKLVKVLVPAKSTATIRSDYEVNCFYVPSSANAQTLGTLTFQRKLLPSATISFSAKGKILQQEPDDIITIKPINYGAPTGSPYDVLIDSFVIEKDLQVSVTATRFSATLDDWGDITPSTVTIATDTSEYAYSPIMAGPDSTGQTGTAIPNRVPGKFIVGNETNQIYFDPVIPRQGFIQNSVVRMKLGNINTIASPDYGIEMFDADGVSIFKLDGTVGSPTNKLSNWDLGQYTLTCASGVVGLNSEVTGGTDWRIWAGHATPGSAPFRVDENGNLVATSATISGAISAATIDIGGDDASSFHVDINGEIWSGASIANKATAPFRVSNAGALVATSATITGSITATSGAIGGWDIIAGYIYNLQSGTPTASPNDGIVLASGNEALIVYEDTEKRIELGYLSAGVYGLKGYATDGSAVIFELSDTQTKIAGWTIDSTSLTSVSGGNTTIVSSGVTAFTAGPTGVPTFTVTQAGVITATSGYIGGAVNGWAITAGLLTAAGTGIIQTSASASTGIKINSTALYGYNGTVQTVEINTDGSGWFGLTAARAIEWTTAGVVTVADWTVSATRIASANVFIDQAGQYISMGATPPTAYGNNVGAWLGVDTVAKLSLYADANNYFQWNGALLTWKGANSSLDASGNITATGGTIGGWDVVPGYIYNLQSGTPTVDPSDGIVLASGNEAIIIYEDTEKRIELGYLAAGIYGLKGYATNGTTVTFELSDTQSYIAGFTFDAVEGLYAGAGDTRVQMKPGAGIWCGETAIGDAEFSVTNAGVLKAVYGTIGGCALGTTSIGSTSFTSGPLGVGWNISNTGIAEFQNIRARGKISTSVFEKDTISAINGMFIISKADVLSANMTALDASTLTIIGDTTFVNNEVIRIKDGVDDEWLLVTDASAAPIYTITRDLATAYAADTNPIWKAGTAVVSMGVGTGTKTGFILMDSSSANSPFIDIYARNSNTYSDYTLKSRLGWLQGIVDADVGLNSTDVWGLYSGSVYLKGVVVANTGYIGGTSGWVISAGYIKDVAGVVGLSAVVTGGDDIRFWAGHATPASAPFYVTEAGVLKATSATIGGWTVDTTSIYTGTEDHSGYTTNAGDITIYSDGSDSSIHAKNFYIDVTGTLYAQNVNVSGYVSGSYIYGSSLMTKGTYLSSTCGAGDATLNVGDTTDFAASGTAYFIDSANDRDAFTYTGKTATTLTGCSGELAHTVSATNKPLVVPTVKGIYISDAANEMRFFGNRGDGTIEELASIGSSVNGSFIEVGSLNSSVIGLYAKANDSYGIYAITNSGYGIYGTTTSGYGVSGISSSGIGVYGDSTTGTAIHSQGVFVIANSTGPASYPTDRVFLWSQDVSSLAAFHIYVEGGATYKFTNASFITSANFLPNTDNSLNLGSASYRWANIYTADFHLKNDEGDWTIKEGKDDLFLINNKTKKRYSFVLKEI